MRRSRPAILVAAAAMVASLLPAPPASAEVNVYTTPGQHTINGRQWRTWCEKYSRTARCRTEIVATTVKEVGGQYMHVTGWTFNNLTYLSSPASMWKGNPMARTGSFTKDGRQWKTECYTPRTGSGCRSYILSDVVEAVSSGGRWTYRVERKWQFNNIVQFGRLRSDIASLVTWRPRAQPRPTAPTAIPDSTYSIRRGPNLTDKVVLSYDDCPKSRSAFRETLLAAKQMNIGLVLFPTGDCISAGRFDPAFARAHGHYVFNHSVSHPQFTNVSYSAVQRQLSAPGVVTTYGRPPYGAFNSTVKRAYASKGMRIWTWTVDTSDWRGKSASSVVNYVINTSTKGDAVLMHMQWNGFSPSAIRSMKNGLAAKGLQVCRNYPGTTPARPAALSC